MTRREAQGQAQAQQGSATQPAPRVAARHAQLSRRAEAPAPALRDDRYLVPRLDRSGGGPRTVEFSAAELHGGVRYDGLDDLDDFKSARSTRNAGAAAVVGGEAGRHRGPRKPLFRAAVPIAAVLAAGGGAFALIHVAETGQQPENFNLSNGLPAVISAPTTTESNAPAGVDGGTAPSSAVGPLTTQTADTGLGLPGGPATRTGSAPALLPSSIAGGTVIGTSAPASTATGTAAPLPSNDPVSIATTSASPSGPTSTATTPAPPTSSTSGTTPTQTPTPTPTPPGTPGTTTPTPPTPTPTTPTPTPTPSTPTPTTPTQTPPPASGGSGAPSSTPPPTPESAPTSLPPSTSHSPAPARSLSPGDQGPDVAELQIRLDRLIRPAWIPVSGVYDNRTAQAVLRVQQALHVVGDAPGVYGPNTNAALLRAAR